MRQIFSMLFLLLPALVLADPNGKTGFTSKISTGCGGCHGGNAGAAVSIALEGPRSIKPGEKVDFSIIVGHATARSAGVSVTVRSTATGMMGAVGTLSIPPSGSGLRVRTPGSGQEITQAAPKTMSGGTVTFPFSWTAPSTPGTYWVQAVANAVNGDGSESNADDWSFLEPVAITVEATSSVEDLPVMTTIYPNPLAPSQTLHLDAELSGATQITIMNAQGLAVINEMMDLQNGALPRPLAELPRGVYFVTATSGSVTRRGSFIIE